MNKFYKAFTTLDNENSDSVSTDAASDRLSADSDLEMCKPRKKTFPTKTGKTSSCASDFPTDTASEGELESGTPQSPASPTSPTATASPWGESLDDSNSLPSPIHFDSSDCSLCDRESDSDSDPLSETDYINKTPNLSSNPISSLQEAPPESRKASTVPVSIKLDSITTTTGNTGEGSSEGASQSPPITDPPLNTAQNLSTPSECTLVTVSAPADSFQTVDTSLITELTDTSPTQATTNTTVTTVTSKPVSDHALTTSQSKPPVASFLSMSKQCKTVLNGVPGVMIPVTDRIGQCNIKQFFPQSPINREVFFGKNLNFFTNMPLTSHHKHCWVNLLYLTIVHCN